MKKHSVIPARTIAVIAIMAALSTILMILEFSIPIVPWFLKFDFSDLPAFLTAFAISPLAGVAVELIKNILHLFFTTTSGVGELANFIVGASLVLPAGLIYRYRKNRRGAILGAAIGTIAAALISIPVNYFITYPFYANFMSMESILDLYKAIVPAADTLIKALLIFNMPFTFVKGLVSVLITFCIYKKISPLLKGKSSKAAVSGSAVDSSAEKK